MQALKYIANLQCSTQKLQKTVKRMRSIQSVSDLQRRTNSDSKDSVIMLSGSRRPFRNEQQLLSSDKSTASLEHVREKLLFRHIPITLSLLERNMWVLRKIRKRLQIKAESENSEAHALTTSDNAKRNELVTRTSPELTPQISIPEHSSMTANVLCGMLEDDRNRSSFPDHLVDHPAVAHSHGDSTLSLTDRTSNLGNSTTGTSQSYDKRQRGLVPLHSALASVPHAKGTSRILRLLHIVESERRQLLHEKRKRITKRLHRLDANFAHGRKHTKPLTDASPSAVERDDSEGDPGTTGESLPRDHHDTYIELELLNQSLLARPFLSARLWKLLLDDDVWKGAIAQQQRLINDGMPHQGHHGTQHSMAFSGVFPLLSMSILLSRIVLGTFRDYVDGVEVNKFAPRFVVSLPSVAWLSKKQHPMLGKAEKGGSKAVQPSLSSDKPVEDSSKHAKEEKASTFKDGGEEEEEDLLLNMIRQTSDLAEIGSTPNGRESAVEVSSAFRENKLTRSKSKRRHSTAKLRWMPPRSAKVLPLTVETLTTFSFILQHLPIRAIVRANSAHEVLSLLSMLQHIATAVLLMARGNGSVGSQTLHATLKNLEKMMLITSRELHNEMVGMLQEEDTVPTQTPEQAARMIIEMSALHLLPLRDLSTVKLLNRLITAVFPELRTNTLQVLMEKSRQNHLLAFATRKHRLKLHEQHGPSKAEPFVLGTIIQQARLRQRQMAMALRAAYLGEVHQRAITELGRALPPHDRIALLQILTGALSLEHHHGRREDPSVDQKRMVTAALFVVESLLVSKALDEADAARDLPLEDWARLWITLLALRPVVGRWREAARRSPHQAHGRSEGLIVDAAMEMAYHGMAAILAERLDGIRAREKRGPQRSGLRWHASPNMGLAGGTTDDNAPSAQSLSIVGLGIRKWREHHENEKKYPAVERLSRQVEVLAKLLREVLLYDTALRYELRHWEVEKRETFHREMTECLRAAELLDNTSESGLRLICFKL
ncbi:unnamed protein product [Phytomonas sp. Hart1]|nr:unnamed protein product [Phytomonas sp. Hart1]|eukprot:CCW69966.1 unnamed protein product [Phytomonas sp. isolate Hart1]